MFDAEKIQSQTDQSQSQSGMNFEALERSIEEHWDHLLGLLRGDHITTKRMQFFQGHRERVRLQFEVQRGPFSFQEYYTLCDLLWDRVDKAIRSDDLKVDVIMEEAGLNDLDHAGKISFCRNLTHAVILPEFIVRYVKDRYPKCDPVSKVRELSEEGSEFKDYVNYLLSRRDMRRWAQSKSGSNKNTPASKRSKTSR